MNHHTQLDHNLRGDKNFRAWKYRISLILEENDLDKYISEEFLAPEGDVAKDIHKNNMVKAERIISNSIKDHLIPHVSSLKTPKEVLDALMKLFKWNNINQKMILRNQLNNAKIQTLDSMQSYFMRVSQIKDQLEAVEEKV